MQDMIIHVGYPKAASSHVQEKLFKQHHEVNYLNVNFPCDLYEDIYKTPTEKYDENKNLNLKRICVDENLVENKVNVIADERFTANIINYRVVARRLKHLFPEAKILMIVRNQMNILRSRYDMHPYNYNDKSKKWLNLDDWLKSYLSGDKSRILDSLFFDEALALYIRLFGSKNVRVFLFEEIISRDPVVLEDLFTFLNINNKTLATELLKGEAVNQAGNHILYHLKLRLFPSFSFSRFISKKRLKVISNLFSARRKTQITPFFTEAVRNAFSESNLKLSMIIKKDLSKYDYPL